MRARDIMTQPVVTVTPDTAVADIAHLLLERQLSAVPVLDGNRMVGIVSEGDLIRRIEAGTEGRASWWLRTFGPRDDLASDYIRTRGMHARDVMTSPVVSVNVDATVAHIAELLEAKRIKRVPVLEGSLLVGIVSRANLLHAVAAGRNRPIADTKPEDAAIRSSILGELGRQPWARNVTVNVTVEDGVVSFWGLVHSPTQREALRVVAEQVPGVTHVDDHLTLFDVRSIHPA